MRKTSEQGRYGDLCLLLSGSINPGIAFTYSNLSGIVWRPPGDPTEGLADVEQIAYRSTGSRNCVCAPYRELMRFEIPDLFDFAVEALANDVPEPCCCVWPPLLRNCFIDPSDQGWWFDHYLAPTAIHLLFLRSLVKLLFQVSRNVFRVERLDVPSS